MSKSIKFGAGDIVVDEQGLIQETEDLEKSAQDIGFNLSTEYDPVEDYGSELVSSELTLISGTQSSAPGIIGSFVRRSIQRHDRQQQVIQDIIPDNERFKKIKSLVVRPYSAIPGSFAYLVEIENVSGESTKKAMLVDFSHQGVEYK